MADSGAARELRGCLLVEQRHRLRCDCSRLAAGLPGASGPDYTTTYVAHWQLDGEGVIELNLNDAEGQKATVTPSRITGEFETFYEGTLPVPTRPGYKFDGWKNADDEIIGANETVKIEFVIDPVTFTAQWTPLEAQIAFVTQYTNDQGSTVNGSRIDPIVGLTDGDVAEANDGSLNIPESTLAGYSISWFDNALCTGDEVTVLPATFAPGTTTYYAKWTPNAASITLHGNGGTIAEDKLGIFTAGDNDTYTVESVTGAAISNWRFPEITRTGYTFLGWFDNEGMTGAARRSCPPPSRPETPTTTPSGPRPTPLSRS